MLLLTKIQIRSPNSLAISIMHCFTIMSPSDNICFTFTSTSETVEDTFTDDCCTITHSQGLCRVHTARFSNSSGRRCFHTAGLSGVAFSRCCFHIARWIRDRGFHIARFHNRKNRRQLCLIRKYSQTHTRSDKEITQDQADIMVYKSSPNTQ